MGSGLEWTISISVILLNNYRRKSNNKTIAVSCFTATAKQKVIADICDYFESKLGLKLEIFATTSTRKTFITGCCSRNRKETSLIP